MMGKKKSGPLGPLFVLLVYQFSYLLTKLSKLQITAI